MAVGVADNLPQMMASSYASNTIMLGETATYNDSIVTASPFGDIPEATRRLLQNHRLQQRIQEKEDIVMAVQVTRRIVQVFIVDPNDNVPLTECLLYKGEPIMTDLTDQELFFEIDIKDILAKHNEKRTKIANKSIKDRVEYLEPAKVRDLKMTVVNIATF